MRTEIPFNGPTQEGRLNLVGAQQSVNLYPKLQSPGDKNKVSLYSTPGLKWFTQRGVGPCRTPVAVEFKSKLYFVSGADLISIDADGVTATAGTLATSGGTCVMAAGRNYLAIVDGTNGYVYSNTYSTFSQIKQFSTGSADTNTLNKLEDTTATFITDGVVAGVVVYNTTDGTKGTVSAVDSETALSIVNTSGAAYDLFPLGTEAYGVGSDNFPAASTHITYQDFYFITNKGSSDEFAISAAGDPTDWAALDFANAEAHPDDILALVANQKDLILCGETTTQVYYDSKNADFPYEPYPNGVIQAGIEAKYSLVSAVYGIIFLSRTREGELRVVKLNGLSPTALSSDDIDWQISQFSDATDAIAWVERDGDRTLYVITFPTADKTYCCDLGLPKEIAWFEKKSWGVGRWRAAGYGAIGSKRIIGDYLTGDFYTLDFDTFDENGVRLERIRRAQIVHSDKKDFTINEFLLDVQVGVGLTTGQGSDPQVMMRYSHNGGETWSSEIWVDLGKIGERATEVYWSKLGNERDWVFEVKVTDPVEFNIIAAYADIEEADF